MDLNQFISKLMSICCRGCDGEYMCGCSRCTAEDEIEAVVKEYLELNNECK